MSDSMYPSKTYLLLFVLFCLVMSASVAQAQPEVEIEIGQAAGLPGDLSFDLNVYLRNYVDTIAGFELWFIMDRPGVAGFVTKIDTVGTLVSNWDYLDCRSVSVGGLDSKVTGMCDATPPFTKRGIPPQDGRTPLISLQVFIPDPPDPYTDSVFVHLVPVLENFGLATPDGRSVGITTCVQYDTTYLNCTRWQDSVCLAWEEVPGPPSDTFALMPYDVFCVDTVEAIHLVRGFVRVGDSLCGDIDGTLDGLVSMSDLTRLIDQLFISLTPVRWPALGNVDGSPDGLITMSDLTSMIDHLFISLEPLDCGLD
jgi:hypothetical protein